jgi:hypothetical protein
MNNHGYVDPFDLQSEITFAHVVFASCAGFPLAAVFGSDDIVCPRKRAMNHSEGKGADPRHTRNAQGRHTSSARNRLGSGSESDIVDQVYRAMVRASRKPRSCTRELEKQDAMAESEGPST